jgi:small subunit ribosomal protein MRP21
LVANLSSIFEKLYDKPSNQNMNARLAASDAAYMSAAYTSKGMSSSSTAPLRLKPSLGRTLEVYTGMDVTAALRKLEVTCARNRVRYDFERQRFHVRRGMKKKLMKMQRWRVVFKEGFLAECARVRKMRKQGW